MIPWPDIQNRRDTRRVTEDDRGEASLGDGRGIAFPRHPLTMTSYWLPARQVSRVDPSNPANPQEDHVLVNLSWNVHLVCICPPGYPIYANFKVCLNHRDIHFPHRGIGFPHNRGSGQPHGLFYLLLASLGVDPSLFGRNGKKKSEFAIFLSFLGAKVLLSFAHSPC